MSAHFKSVLLALLLAGLVAVPTGAAIAADPPANDDFANASLITVTHSDVPYTDSVDTSGATAPISDPFDPVPSVGVDTTTPRIHTVWYKFTPSGDGLLSINTIGSNFDTVLAVYSDSSGSLAEVAADNDSGGSLTSAINSLNLYGGNNYYVLATGTDSNSFGILDFSATWSQPGDEWSSAWNIDENPYNGIANIGTLTVGPGDPHPSCAQNSGQATLWYKIHPTDNISLTVDTIGSTYSGGTTSFDTVMAVYSDGLSEIACDDDNNHTSNGPSRISDLKLAGGSTYYIMVIPFAGGYVGTVRLNVSYTVVPPPAMPEYPQPSDNSAVISMKTWLGWDDPQDGLTYTVVMGTDSGSMSPVPGCEAITVRACNPGPLAASTQYWWAVKASNGFDEVVVDPPWNFITAAGNIAPGVPDWPTPDDDAIDVALDQPLSWMSFDPDGDQLTFTVYFGTNPDTQPIITCPGIHTSMCTPALEMDQTYYWHVDASDGTDTSHGLLWRFSTVHAAPVAPNAPSNLQAEAVSGSQIWLDWTDNSTNETSFRIERSANGTSGWTEIKVVDADVTDAPDSGLACGTRFFYRIRARNAGGDSAYSATANATTTACGPMPRALKAPRLLAPKAGLLTKVQTQIFTWRPVAGATGYRIQIATDRKFTAFVTNELVAGPTYTGADMPEGVYYWRVATMNSERQGRFTGRRGLTIDITPPAAPVVRAPLNAAIIADMTPRLSVFKAATAIRYQFQVSTGPAFGSTVIDITVRSTSYTIPRSKALTPKTPYYWRVLAIDKAGNNSGWSVVATFTTG